MDVLADGSTSLTLGPGCLLMPYLAFGHLYFRDFRIRHLSFYLLLTLVGWAVFIVLLLVHMLGLLGWASTFLPPIVVVGQQVHSSGLKNKLIVVSWSRVHCWSSSFMQVVLCVGQLFHGSVFSCAGRCANRCAWAAGQTGRVGHNLI